jgi:hypothetical protein
MTESKRLASEVQAKYMQVSKARKAIRQDIEAAETLYLQLSQQLRCLRNSFVTM